MIPVLDVRAGQAVHAQGGDRAHYAPLRSVLHPNSNPVALARAGRDGLGLLDWYVADLDSLAGHPPDLGLYRALADLGLTLWVDAGLRDRSGVAALVENGVDRVIVGLETVAGPSALAAIVAEAGPSRVAFSLDLRDGRPIVATRDGWGGDDPALIVARAVACGVETVIHLDLGRVGTGRGVAELAPAPGVSWVVGGGIAGPADLAALAGRGVAAALVGSALHDGRITRDHLTSLRSKA